MLQKPTSERSIQDSPETEAILRRMEEVRCDLHEGAQEIADSARDMGQWRHYVRNYPWVCVWTASTVGYLIVPRRRLGIRKVHQTLDEMADHNRHMTRSNSPSKRGIRGAALMFAGNLLWRGALSYSLRQANQYFAARSGKSDSEDQV